MPHGTPDWYGLYSLSVNYFLQDLAEHAVRLGSIVSTDRRGTCVLIDGFDKGLAGWELVATDGLHYPRLTVYPSYRSDAALMLHTSEIPGKYTGITKWIQTLEIEGIGIELCIAPDAYLGALEIGVKVYRDGTLYWIRARWNSESGFFELYRSDDTWKELVDIVGIQQNGLTFSTLKVVADLNTGYYNRVIINGVTTRATATEIFTDDTSVGDHTEIYVLCDCGGEPGTHTVIDDIIVTQNEPI
jgi:hypothetical protein